MRWRRNRVIDELLGDSPRWTRLEATIVVGRTAADLAEGEADLLREAKRGGFSVEAMATTDNLRVYRLGVQQ